METENVTNMPKILHLEVHKSEDTGNLYLHYIKDDQGVWKDKPIRENDYEMIMAIIKRKEVKMDYCTYGLVDLVEETRKQGYEKGLEDAWKMAKEIVVDPCSGGIHATDLAKMFCSPWPSIIFATIPVKEAKEKLDVYHEEQKSFHVGDEVTCVDNGKTYRFVITIIKDDIVSFLDDDAKTTVLEHDKFKKNYIRTGRHFNEVEELLKKLKDD